MPGSATPATTPPVALTIAATDSAGGAGLAADLRTFAAHGVHGALAVTAVSAQDTVGVRAIEVMPATLVASQIDAVMADLDPRAAKTGMVASPETVRMLAHKAAAGALPALVVDPVLVSSSGSPLFDHRIVEAYLELVAAATVLTPNLPEAALLTGHAVGDLGAMESAARALQALGPALVVVKGGRRPDDEAVDVAFDGRAVTLLRQRWVASRNVHGTGCSFSAALAADLALGLDPLEAAVAANAYVHEAIVLASSWSLGAGHGPVDQLGAAPGAKRP